MNTEKIKTLCFEIDNLNEELNTLRKMKESGDKFFITDNIGSNLLIYEIPIMMKGKILNLLIEDVEKDIKNISNELSEETQI